MFYPLINLFTLCGGYSRLILNMFINILLSLSMFSINYTYPSYWFVKSAFQCSDVGL